MDLKIIENADFLQLVNMVPKMYAAIDGSINSFQAINTLMHFVNTQENFLAIGLYDEDVLTGFTMGHSLANGVFYFSGIYIEAKNSRYTKLLIDFSFDLIKGKGYSGWQVDATCSNIASIMEKYGAEVLYTRYSKEFL